MLGTILFTDIKASSELWKLDARAMQTALRRHAIQIARLARKYDAMIVKTIGDAYMLMFKHKQSLLHAVKFSMDLQRELMVTRRIKIKNRDLHVRIGIAKGKFSHQVVTVQNKQLHDFFGNAVNVASRMESKVSPVGGFAYTDLTSGDIDEKIIEDLADYTTTLVNFDAKCGEKIHRSRRLIVDSVHCMELSSLRGVLVHRAISAAPTV